MTPRQNDTITTAFGPYLCSVIAPIEIVKHEKINAIENDHDTVLILVSYLDSINSSE